MLDWCCADCEHVFPSVEWRLGVERLPTGGDLSALPLHVWLG